MSGELEAVLRLVAEGRLTPEEAAPIVEALSRADAAAAGTPPRENVRRPAGPGAAGRGGTHSPGHDTHASAAEGSGAGASGTPRARRMRILVSERGHAVVDVQVPLGFAAMAARMVPGIPEDYAALIREAVETDQRGPIVDTEDDRGDGVRITIE